MHKQLIEEFERSIRRDPGARGLIGSEQSCGRLCPDHLAQAALHLAEFGARIALVTGFYVPDATPPAAETDGPPGTVLLAGALQSLGMQVSIVTDAFCAGAVEAAAEADGLSCANLIVYPSAGLDSPADFFNSRAGRDLTHLIAVERVGPSHTPESVRRLSQGAADPSKAFESLVPAENRNRCHNMRGTVIDAHTAPLHELFEQMPRLLPESKTIGIGDGANEIGMGSIPWQDLCRRLPGEHAGRIPCRVPTDWTIVAGTSNWGAYALAAATLLVRGRIEALRGRGRGQQQQVLEHMVAHGPAVDGVTGRRQPTVDGLPFLTYIQPWEQIRRLLGFNE